MSPLRKCLKHPGTYLALFGALVALAGADSFRPPEHQLSANLHCSGARLPACGPASADRLRAMPLPPHLFPLLHRSSANIRTAQGFCTHCGATVALPQCRAPGHRRPAAGVVDLGANLRIILKSKAMPAVLWQDISRSPALASAPTHPLSAARSGAMRFCLPWDHDSGNFRRLGMTGRLGVLASFGENQQYGGNQWLFAADVEPR
jgi:hypothetical protein